MVIYNVCITIRSDHDSHAVPVVNMVYMVLGCVLN